MKRPRPPALPLVFLAALAVLGVGEGCTPKIGDDCVSTLDCSQQGDRLCDVSEPGGYCTIFNCEPDKCPENDGVCVAFDSQLDPRCGPWNDGEWARFERTFCMAACEDDSDCRAGYECAKPAERAASIIDLQPIGTRICLAKIAAAAAQSGAGGQSQEVPAICKPEEAYGPLPEPYVPDAGGGGGAGGMGGAGGAGGADGGP